MMEVTLSSAMPRNVCNCIYHSNVNLILETLHSNILNIFPLNSLIGKAMKMTSWNKIEIWKFGGCIKKVEVCFGSI